MLSLKEIFHPLFHILGVASFVLLAAKDNLYFASVSDAKQVVQIFFAAWVRLFMLGQMKKCCKPLPDQTIILIANLPQKTGK